MTLDFWIIFVFVAYFAALIGIAIVRARRMRAMSDYVLGSRQLSSVTSALSAGSSTTSGWTMLVFPALAFSQGARIIWLVSFMAIGVWLSWTLVAKRLRRYTIETNDSLTLPEFFEKRFEDRSGVLRAICGVLTIFFVIFYVNSGLIAGSKLLDSVFGIEATVGVIITLIAVASYTLIGGFMAVSRTDVFQAMLMLAGFTIMPVTLIMVTDNAFSELGGGVAGYLNPFTYIESGLAGMNPFAGMGVRETVTGFLDPFTYLDVAALTPVVLLGYAGWAIGGFGAQRVLQRFMAVEREAVIGRSRNISFVWVVLIFSLGFLLGILAQPALEAAGVPVPDPERLFFVVSDHFFPAVISGLLLTAVIAAVMSTADSQLLLSSAIATDDLPLMRKFAYSLSTDRRVWLGRVLLIVVGLVSGALAISAPDSIFNLVSYAWGGMGATFGPVALLALYWRRFNLWGAFAGVIVGFAVVTTWQFALTGGPQGLFDIMPCAPAFAIAGVAAIVVTLLTSPPSDRITATFDKVVAGDPAYA